MNFDLAGKSHWDNIYSLSEKSNATKWKPSSYLEILLDRVFKSIFEKYKPQKILEIGCGNSFWLPYLANLYDVEVCGIDYSQEGVSLAKKRLDDLAIDGNIFCVDIFEDTSFLHGNFDLVFSLGLVEHFENTNDVLSKIQPFLSKNGILFTEIPNFNFSFYYFFTYIYQPKQLFKHKPLGLDMLVKSYSENNLEVIDGEFLGIFSLGIVAWGHEPRFEFFGKKITSFLKHKSIKLDSYFLRKKKFKSLLAFFSPFIYLIGTRKCVE